MRYLSDSSIENPQSPTATESETSNELVRNLFKYPVEVAKQFQPSSSHTTVTRYRPENSTSRPIKSNDLNLLANKANIIFSSAKEEVFEDGMESKFSQNLSTFILSFGRLAMEVLIPIMLSEYSNKEVVSEAFRIIGRISHKATYRDRLWLLERGLYSSSARVRDGVVLGLAFLDDSFAISPLKSAIERERIPELRQDMEQVLAQLEGIENGILTKKNTEK